MVAAGLRMPRYRVWGRCAFGRRGAAANMCRSCLESSNGTELQVIVERGKSAWPTHSRHQNGGTCRRWIFRSRRSHSVQTRWVVTGHMLRFHE